MKPVRGRRPATARESRRPPPETPQLYHNSRDSDASFCSSRPPSSVGSARPVAITDPGYKQSAVRAINSYLASHNIQFAISLKPVPSTKDIFEVFRFLFSRFQLSVTNNKQFEDEILLLLKFLNYPYKINKSALRAPGTPHSFPTILAVMHWLVQSAQYTDHLLSDENTGRSAFLNTPVMNYCVNTYCSYMTGDDEAVESLDREFDEKMEEQKNLLTDELRLKDDEVKKLELELEGLKSIPSKEEVYERQRKNLEEDLSKFQEYIARMRNANAITKKAIEEKEKELFVKLEEIRQIIEESEDIKKRVESQGFNLRDAERMKRELLAIEREINEAEASRNSWEEKCWDLDVSINHKFQELVDSSVECNQVLKRLKFGGDLHYVLNRNGSTPAEVLGIDYKSTLKPALNSFAEEIKKSTKEKLEEFITLQRECKEITVKVEKRRNRLNTLQSHVDERAQQSDAIRNEIEEYRSWCASEAKKIREDMEANANNLDIMQREVNDTFMATELKLIEETRQSEEETQLCANELLALVDSVAKYKEHMETKISEISKVVSETAQFTSNAYENTLSTQLNITRHDKEAP